MLVFSQLTFVVLQNKIKLLKNIIQTLHSQNRN